MNAAAEVLEKGGPVVKAILLLSVVLYARAFSLLLTLSRSRRRIARECGRDRSAISFLRAWQTDMQEMFQRQRVTLGAMIAAAPLLGLLGTVSGMISTFQSLSDKAGQKSMDRLAAGISEALIATEAGLAVAIPGVLILYYAHRQLQKGFQTAAFLEYRILQGT